MKIKKRSLLILGISVGLTAFGLNSATMAFADVTSLTNVISASDAVSALLGGSSSISVQPGSESLIGNVQSFDSIDLGTNSTILDTGNTGIVLSSGALSGYYMGNQYYMGNTGYGLAADDSTPAAQALMESMNSVLHGAGVKSSVTDVSALSFDFTVNDPNNNALSLNFIFGSSEYFNNPNYPDVAAVIVDGVNYARMPNGSILVVTPAAGLNDVGQPSNESCWSPASKASHPIYISGDGYVFNICSASETRALFASLDPSLEVHHVDFVVSDVRDRSAPSMLAFSFPKVSISLYSGIFAGNALDAPTVSRIDTGSAEVTFGDALYPSTYTARVYDAAGNLIQTLPYFSSGDTIYGLSPVSQYHISITATSEGYDDVTASSDVFSTAMVKTLTADGGRPSLTNFNGILTCSLPQYFLDGILRERAVPQGVIYQLYANGERISTLSSDKFQTLPKWLIEGSLGSLSGSASVLGAQWSLSDLKLRSNVAANYTCDVIVVNSNTSSNGESNTLSIG